jgi:hypothetical protein
MHENPQVRACVHGQFGPSCNGEGSSRLNVSVILGGDHFFHMISILFVLFMSPFAPRKERQATGDIEKTATFAARKATIRSPSITGCWEYWQWKKAG